ncbi:MAG: putative response regulator, CheY [Verrucomicrobiales bacterium]|nr:putative response regulator, CheY [Verrucomicrobiales bacterium]
MTNTKTILIAEDSEQDLQMLLRSFHNAGVQNPFHVVRDGLAAIHYLGGTGAYQDRSKFPFPSILLLDLNMPRKDGFDVLAFLREHSLSTNLLTVVLTGLADSRLIDKAYMLGAHSFLRKPTRPEELQNLANFFKDHWLLASPPHQLHPSIDVRQH